MPDTSKDHHQVHFEEGKREISRMNRDKRSLKEDEEEEKASNPLKLNAHNVLKVAVAEAKDIG